MLAFNDGKGKKQTAKDYCSFLKVGEFSLSNSELLAAREPSVPPSALPAAPPEDELLAGFDGVLSPSN
jgi:hypothetical protein